MKTLVETLTVRNRRASDAQHRLARLRVHLEAAIRDLSTRTKAEAVVRAELRARGVRL
jgi:hypothetical protein